MTDSDLQKIADLTPDEKKELLQWWSQLPDGEAELDRLTQTPSRKGKKRWTENPQLVEAVHKLLFSIMGPESPYQFASITMLYKAYRGLQDRYEPYGIWLGRDYFAYFVRKWIMQHAPQWEEKSAGRKNKVRLKFPYGAVSSPWAGFGKKTLLNAEKLYSLSVIPLETAWNSQAYYTDQPTKQDVNV